MLWMKAFHIVFMVTWFAGLFYLPRLFVYHADATNDPAGNERFKIMERRLSKIMSLGALGTLILGVLLLIQHQPQLIKSGWMHAKLLLVVLLIGYHGFCQVLIAKFRRDENTRSARWYRVFNEVPVLALVGIIVLVVVRPF